MESCINRIINGDCLEILPNIPQGIIDLVVTSPPYNVKEFQRGSYDVYVDDRPYTEYIKWLQTVFQTVFQTLKPGGRVCINIGDGQNGAITTHADIIAFMKVIGYIPMTTIILDKRNASNRQSWGSFKSPSCPSFPTPFEYLLVFAKETKKLQEKGETDLTKEEFIEWSSSMWFLPARSFDDCVRIINSGVHPAPFPEEIPIRCIKMFSWKDALVLDPFAGYATTAVVCKKLGRRFIMIEQSEDYCKKAEKRLQYLITTDSLFDKGD